MKLKCKFVIMEIDEGFIAVPVGETDNGFRGVLQLNETAKDICEGLSSGLTKEQIVEKFLKEYEGVDLKTASNAVDRVVIELEKKGLRDCSP